MLNKQHAKFKHIKNGFNTWPTNSGREATSEQLSTIIVTGLNSDFRALNAIFLQFSHDTKTKLFAYFAHRIKLLAIMIINHPNKKK